MSFPNNEFWLHLAGSIGLGTVVVLGLVLAAQFFIRTPAWRRALWQIGMISLLALLTTELTGLGRGVGAVVWGQSKPVGKVTVEISPAPITPLEPAIASPHPLTDSRIPAATHPTPVWWPGIVWSAGLALVLLRIALAQGLLSTLRLRGAAIVNPELESRIAQIGGQLGLRRKATMIEVPGLNTPIAFGLLKPRIGLPPGFCDNFSSEQQDAMLAHELAHLAARDPLWYLLTDVATACLWWHPLVWLARRQLHAASEQAADEASAFLENGPESLAECLVQLARSVDVRPRWAWMGVDGGFRSGLGQRVHRLLSLDKSHASPVRRGSFLLVKTSAILGLSLGIVFSSGWLQGQGLTKQARWQGTLKQSWDSSAGVMMLAALETSTGATIVDANAHPSNPQQLFNKTFKIDTDIVHEQLGDSALVAMNSTNPVPTLRALLAKAGVDMSAPGKTILYNGGTSEMLVRANLDDIIAIKQLLDPAASGPKTPNREENSNLALQLERVKLLYEAHCYDSAEMLLREVPTTDRANNQALHYQELINSARIADMARAGKTNGTSSGLYSRTFQVDARVIHQQLGDYLATLNPTNSSLALRTIFGEAGVDLTAPGKSLIYIPSNSSLLVRASLADLELIENVLDLLNRPPDQLVLEAKFYDTDEATAAEFSGSVGITNIATIITPGVSGSFTNASSTSVTNTTEHGTILTDSQFRATENHLKKLDGDILTAPKVATLSGRQARFGMHDVVKNVVTGVTLDVIPRLAADGYTLKLLIIIRQTKWLESSDGQPPRLGENMILARCSVRDGDTVVLQRLTGSKKKCAIAFITPTLIDPAGNRLHTDAELEGFSAK